jgi:hypothetical protein
MGFTLGVKNGTSITQSCADDMRSNATTIGLTLTDAQAYYLSQSAATSYGTANLTALTAGDSVTVDEGQGFGGPDSGQLDLQQMLLQAGGQQAPGEG